MVNRACREEEEVGSLFTAVSPAELAAGATELVGVANRFSVGGARAKLGGGRCGPLMAPPGPPNGGGGRMPPRIPPGRNGGGPRDRPGIKGGGGRNVGGALVGTAAVAPASCFTVTFGGLTVAASFRAFTEVCCLVVFSVGGVDSCSASVTRSCLIFTGSVPPRDHFMSQLINC